MAIKSLDPRVSRLNIEYDADNFEQPKPMDQLETYQIFTEVREGKGYTHVGIMHAANEKLAFLEAKEQYGRRGKCFGVWTVKTKNITVSDYAPIDKNIFDSIDAIQNNEKEKISYDVFIQKKRGKQHSYLCTVNANSPQEAFFEAKKIHQNEKGCNLWTAKSNHILKTTEEDKQMFVTAPEKQFREALIYKIKDRIDAYRIKNNMN